MAAQRARLRYHASGYIEDLPNDRQLATAKV
jgi:hypothetical protein